MRKKLTITQLVIVLCSALLPLLDGMFTWIAYNDYENISKKSMSLSNIMTVQQIGGGPFLYYIFYIGLALMLAYCLLELFCENRVVGQKAFLAIPVLPLVLDAIMMITVDNHTDTYTWEGELRRIAVSLDILAYVGIILLSAVFIIECYKQFKCKD